MPAKPTVFISYRRQTAADLARYIHHRLTTLRYDVFLDVETINGGRFADVIQHEIKGRDVFVVILTPDTLQSEWVVREIKTALENQKPIVPLVAQGFTFATSLPDEIHELSDYDAVRWEHAFADTAFERLLKAVDPRSSLRPRPAWQGVGALVSVAILIVILAVFAPTIFRPAVNPTATVTASKTPSPTTGLTATTAIPLVDMPTGVQIMNLDTTVTEIMLQRTVDAKKTVISGSFAESTHLAETAHAPTNTPFIPLDTTATQVIDFGLTATEALLQRTIVAQGVVNATLLAENTRIVQTSTLTATLSPTPIATATTTGYPCAGTIITSDSSSTLYVVHAEASMASALRDPIEVGQMVTILKKVGTIAPNIWYEIAGEDEKTLGWIGAIYVRPSAACPTA